MADRLLDAEIMDPDKIEFDSLTIGSLTSRGQRSNYLGSLPFLVFPSVIAMLQAEKCQGLILGGPALRYAQAAIRSLYFVDEEGLEDEYGS